MQSRPEQSRESPSVCCFILCPIKTVALCSGTGGQSGNGMCVCQCACVHASIHKLHSFWRRGFIHTQNVLFYLSLSLLTGSYFILCT